MTYATGTTTRLTRSQTIVVGARVRRLFGQGAQYRHVGDTHAITVAGQTFTAGTLDQVLFAAREGLR